MCSVGLGDYRPCDDPQGPQVKGLAAWAVEQYNLQGHCLTLIRVVKCESQVVSGVNYRLTLLAKDNQDNHERFYETVVFEKIWEHYRELVYFKPVAVPGSYFPCQDREGQHVKETAEWAVEEYNKQGHCLTLIRVLKCESQVVSGVNYRLTLLAKDNQDNHERFYETVVFEKIWEHYRELVYFKPVAVPGSYFPCQDREGQHVKETAEWAVEEYNKQGHCLTLIRVLKCESQVVAGVNYRLVLLAKDDKNCENNYETVVWEKLEGQGRELTYFKLLLTQ